MPIPFREFNILNFSLKFRLNHHIFKIAVKIFQVFIGSCMTNIGHFRAAAQLLKPIKDPLPTRLWVDIIFCKLFFSMQNLNCAPYGEAANLEAVGRRGNGEGPLLSRVGSLSGRESEDPAGLAGVSEPVGAYIETGRCAARNRARRRKK